MARPVSIIAFNSILGLKELVQSNEPCAEKLPAWLRKPVFYELIHAAEEISLEPQTHGKKPPHYYHTLAEINFLIHSPKEIIAHHKRGITLYRVVSLFAYRKMAASTRSD